MSLQPRRTKRIALEAKVESVWLTQRPKSIVSDAQSALTLNPDGLAGDKHAGWTRPADVRVPHYPRKTEIRNTRQLTIVSIEELRLIADELGIASIDPSWLGANLTLSGVASLTLLPPGTRMFFPGQAALAIEEENVPCIYPGKVIQSEYPEESNLSRRFPKAAKHRRGLTATVERPGIISVGDLASVRIPEQVLYADILSAYNGS